MESDNIVLNMSAGLLPKDLSENECKILSKDFGEDWFHVLGYDEKHYEKPNSMTKTEEV
jgi:hypothetical protein